jgi:long-subunit fatty acid transport protein
MERFFKLKCIARIESSIFPFTFHKKNTSYQLHVFLFCCFISLWLYLPQAHASFMEQIAIDPKAISLANSVTADPPGILSIHYNPAGLSLMGDGNYISLGAIPVILLKTDRFTKDPNSEPFHDFRGDVIEDPVANTESTNSSGRMYIPVIDSTLDMLAAPIFGISHRKEGSKWTFGFSSYVPYAGGWECGDNASRFGGKSVTLQHLIYAGPAVSYRVNNNLSFGAAFGLGQTAMNISMDMRSPNEIVNITKILGDATQGMSNPIFDMTIPFPLFGGGIGPYDTIGNIALNVRDDFSPSFNLGVLWEPFDWLSFGAVYQSAIKAHLSGKYEMQYSDAWQRMVSWSGSTAIMQIMSIIFDLPYETTSMQSGNATAELEWPQMASFGVKIKPIKRLSLMADLHWAEWSSVKRDNIEFDQKIQLLQLAKYMGYTGGSYNMILERNFKDTWNWSVGVQYELFDWLALRAGYENRTGSTQDQYYDLLYALPTVDYYGAGMGIKLKNNIDIDLALGWLVNKSYKVNNGTSVNMNSTQLGSGLNNPYRGLNYEQEMNIILGALKATMPLEVVTDMLYAGLDMVTPAKWRGTKKKVVTEELTPPDITSRIINNLRTDGKYFYTEDSE